MNFKIMTYLKIACILLGILLITSVDAQKINYQDNLFKPGITVEDAAVEGIEINFSIKEFLLNKIIINREEMSYVSLPGHFLPNDEGKPNLPGKGYFIALPQNAKATLEVETYRTEEIDNIEIAPSPKIPKDSDNNPLVYEKDEAVYSKDAFYPENPIILSEKSKMRGVDVVKLGITPFQYNPVTKELLVHRDIKIKISFSEGNEHFGEDRLRSRWFDPILSDALLNYSSLPKINYNERYSNRQRDDGYEYLIVTPNDSEFQQWADTIKEFRIKQGIITDIVTLSEIGGNDATLLESYFDSAYNNWDIPPVAVLLLGDYGYSADNSIISPYWNSYCVSDNIYADVDKDDLPDITFARMTARDEDELEVMITKFINHETKPPTNADFYDNPITALGWQTERWFQICSESVGGFFKHELGKDPERINAIYEGNPNSDPWSTAPNTDIVLDYFGPNGQDYIPELPSTLGGWTGGNATKVNDAINSGAFMLQHRDHGYEYGWGEPSYSNSDINGLTNTDLCFVMSINCLTGKYNISSECFTEKFHRYTYDGDNSGALGLIAASEVSYSFVNDTYVWGVYDNMWTDFLPDYETNPESRGLKPAFGNSAGKYYLEQSGWPYNPDPKEVTYYLFHHHGDAFLTLYSEVPENLTVAHNAILIAGVDNFTVTSDDGSFIALTVNNEIIGTAYGTGDPVNISIPPQSEGATMIVTITKRNYYRYEKEVPVISPEDPYCLHLSHTVADENENDTLEYGETAYYSVEMKNWGNTDASDIEVTLSTDDDYISITDNTEFYGDIIAHETVTIDSGYKIKIAADVPNDHSVLFNVKATDGNDIWNSCFISRFYSPVLTMAEYNVIDTTGNDDERIDRGETVDLSIAIANNGGAEAFNALGELVNTDEYITINTNNLSYGNIGSGDTIYKSFSVTASESTPIGHETTFTFDLTADSGLSLNKDLIFNIGRYDALVLDLDPGQHSGPQIKEAIESLDLNVTYLTKFPEDDHDLTLYRSIFTALGIFYSNHELTTNEGNRLADYLKNDGNLYMEGRTTWFVDKQTSVHPMFDIEAVSDGWFDFITVYGEPETFTEGMNFEYDGEEPINLYYIEPVNSSFVILRNEEGNNGCVIANETDTYKTIGANCEFGALVDGEEPSTKKKLMEEYLKFFNVYDPTVGIEEYNINNTIDVMAYPNPFIQTINFDITIPETSNTIIEIFDIQGRKVSTLVNKVLQKGEIQITWNGKDMNGNKVKPGIYFYTINNSGKVYSNKITMIK